jgi:peptidyl-prolyl cis-trans isomerase SurA
MNMRFFTKEDILPQVITRIFHLPIFLIFLIIYNTPSQASDTLLVDKVLAIVGDNIVLLSDIELQYAQLSAERLDMPVEFKCEILEQMLTQKLFLQQAKVDSVVVSDDEINNELDRRIRYFIGMIGSVEKLEAYYEKSIVEIKDEFRKDIAEQMLAQKMQTQIFGTIKVTPSEVKSFFNDIPEDSLPYYNAEVEVMQIVKIPEVSPEQKQLAIEKIEGIFERAMKGEDFAKLAIIYSEDPGSAAKGGDLGFVGRGELVTEFEGAAFRLQPGEISPVVKTKYGYHIIKMIEQKAERIRISHILIKPKITSFDLQNSLTLLDSVRTLIIENKMTFEKAVDKFSDDEDSKNQGGLVMNPQTGSSAFETAQLDKSIYFAIEKMKPGEISLPSLYTAPDGEQATRIIMLRSETKPHVANLKDDYSKIKAAALQKKQQKEMVKWTTLKIQHTYVKLSDDYRDCPNLKHWYQKNDSTQ